MTNRAQQIFKPEFRFGLGGASLGNEFNKHTDKDAEATLEAAWAVGVRYFDVAPWYGFGLAERRFGHFLHNKKREDYLLSSKVGKLFKASKNNRHAEIYPLSDSPNDIVFDYTADGVRRSIEDSLQRLGVDSLDVAFVHDISPDFAFFPNGWEEQYEIARKGAFPALSKMRDERFPQRPYDDGWIWQGKDRDVVHGDGGTLGLGRPEDLSHDHRGYFASREIVEKTGQSGRTQSFKRSIELQPIDRRKPFAQTDRSRHDLAATA